jgi:chorismate mutase
MPRTIEIPEVLEMRDEIARLDHSLVMLVAARQDAVRRLFAVKDRAGRPMFDPKQEALVIRRARRWGREIGAAPEEMQAVFERLIEVARSGATHRRRANKESEVVTVMLAMPPALPKVRVERSSPSMVVAGVPHRFGHDDDQNVPPSDDHHLGPDGRRPKPTHHSHVVA